MKVLKFGAVWCPGCLVMKPRWKEIETDNSWLETEYHDFDQDKEVVEKYHITDVLPVFVFLDKNGNEFLRLDGEINKDKLVEIINQNKDK
ncbi:MAG: thioredoxin family protein [Candidatus Gastranaerophilales bacterium]|nr:thioredoxin family protein [Candidatus Gastranaerophilales bacterium]